jgi:hypothetical protein
VIVHDASGRKVRTLIACGEHVTERGVLHCSERARGPPAQIVADIGVEVGDAVRDERNPGPAG